MSYMPASSLKAVFIRDARRLREKEKQNHFASIKSLSRLSSHHSYKNTSEAEQSATTLKPSHSSVNISVSKSLQHKRLSR